MTLAVPSPLPASFVGKGGAFSSEVDSVGEARWSEITAEFGDANLYQTWPYGVARSGEARVSRLLLKQGATVRAAVQVRIAKIPGLPLGVAYVLSGPLWQRRDGAADVEIFRQALRALRMEYAGRRGLVVRLVPNLFDSENSAFRGILEAEGYIFKNQAPRRRTILMDLEPTLDELQRGLHQKWRNCLNKSRKQNLEMIQGDEDYLFEAFGRIFGEMVDRKQVAGLTVPDHCRKAQAKLLPQEKVRVFLCKFEGEVCAGGICSALGDTGIYLLGATSNQGTKNCSSYLVHWRMLEWVKSRGCQYYDLNGINSVSNPGGYQFKSRLAGAHGREVQLIGQFDAYPNAAMQWLMPIGDWLISKFRK
jgi:Acetyltransferase (GNAT) domain